MFVNMPPAGWSKEDQARFLRAEARAAKEDDDGKGPVPTPTIQVMDIEDGLAFMRAQVEALKAQAAAREAAKQQRRQAGEEEDEEEEEEGDGGVGESEEDRFDWENEGVRNSGHRFNQACGMSQGGLPPLDEKETAYLLKHPTGTVAATLLVGMARRNQLEELQQLVGEIGVPVDACPPGPHFGGERALHHAAGRGYMGCLRYLCLEAHADTEARDADHGYTPLHTAINNREVPAALALLREAGADPAARDGGGRTPLHHAARRGLVEVAACLLERGADPGATCHYGMTPLDVARAEKRHALADLLDRHARAAALQQRKQAAAAAAAARKAKQPQPASTAGTGEPCGAEAEAAAERMAALLLEEEEREAAAAAAAAAGARAGAKGKGKGKGKAGGKKK